MMKQNLKRHQAAWAQASRFFTGYDWTATAGAIASMGQARYALDPLADARAARREWKRRMLGQQHAVATRRASAALRDRVSAWAHARVPGDPCIGAGC